MSAIKVNWMSVFVDSQGQVELLHETTQKDEIRARVKELGDAGYGLVGHIGIRLLTSRSACELHVIPEHDVVLERIGENLINEVLKNGVADLLTDDATVQ